jgi:hypothetical protein
MPLALRTISPRVAIVSPHNILFNKLTLAEARHNQSEDRVMTIRSEKFDPVWTVIHSRPNARNAMDPTSADVPFAERAIDGNFVDQKIWFPLDV